MNADKIKVFYASAPKIISVIFHPLFMPVYGIAIIFSAPTLFGYLPINVKKLLFLIVLVNNVLMPIALMPFFMYRKIISSWAIPDRRERIIPLIVTTLLYAASSYIIFRFPIPVFLKSFIFASFFISLTLTVINFWWKISIHSAAAGSLTAVVIVLSLKMSAPLIWYLIVIVVISGLILSSRLKLNTHNPIQVWFGFFTGFLVLSLYMWFF